MKSTSTVRVIVMLGLVASLSLILAVGALFIVRTHVNEFFSPPALDFGSGEIAVGAYGTWSYRTYGSPYQLSLFFQSRNQNLVVSVHQLKVINATNNQLIAATSNRRIEAAKSFIHRHGDTWYGGSMSISGLELEQTVYRIEATLSSSEAPITTVEMVMKPHYSENPLDIRSLLEIFH